MLLLHSHSQKFTPKEQLWEIWGRGGRSTHQWSSASIRTYGGLVRTLSLLGPPPRVSGSLLTSSQGMLPGAGPGTTL